MDDLLLLVVFALIGLVTKFFIGINLYEAIGELIVIPLTAPLLMLPFIHDPVLLQKFGDNYIAMVIQMLPDVVIGDVAGSIAGVFARAFTGSQ